MRNKSYRLILIFFISLCLMPSYTHMIKGNEEILLTLIHAEESIGTAYQSILEVERAGGDVSDLVSLINIALEYISEAKQTVELEDYDATMILAENAVEVSSSILDIGVSITKIAKQNAEIKMRNQMNLSISIIFLVLFLGILFWRYFGKYNINKMINMKPEVRIYES